MLFSGKLPSLPQVKQDFTAGLTVALILIPQSLAYAQLAGLPVTFGLYAALIAPFTAALFGSSKQLSTGPVAILSVMTAAALTPLAVQGTPEYIALAVALAFCLGLFQIALGLLKLGGLVSLLSHPVVYGFTNAAALIIATTQLSKFFGVTVGSYHYHYQTVLGVLQSAAASFEPHTLVMGLCVLGSMILLKATRKKLPIILIMVVLYTLVSYVTKYDGAIIGNIPTGLPSPRWPDLSFSALTTLGVSVVTMSLIGFTESISIAQAIAVKTRSKVNPNRELLGQGLANLFGSFFQSYPVAGSFSRTAVNYQAGAKTEFSSLFTSGVVLLVLLFFTPFLHYLPQVVLAAIIVYSVAGLLDFRKITHIWNTSKFDAVAALITFVSTLYAAPHLEKGVIVGVLFSLGHYVYRNAHPKVVFMSKYRDGSFYDSERFQLERCENIAIVRLDAPLFFANSAYFEEEIIQYLAKNKYIKFVLIVGSGINEIDSSGEEMLTTMYETLKLARKDLYFSDLKGQVRDVFVTTGLEEKIGKDHFFRHTKEGVQFLISHLEHAHHHRDADKCPLERFVKAEDEQRHAIKDRREKVAYYYKRLFSPSRKFATK